MSIESNDKLKSGSRLLVIVVNFDQEQEIAAFLERLYKTFPAEHTIVVDDGSRDASPRIAEHLGYRILMHDRNYGVGAAIRTGIHYGIDHNYEFVAIMSSNGKIRPEDLKHITTPVLSGDVDYTNGSRFITGGASPGLSRFRRFAIPLFSLLTWPILGRRFSDVTCGYRCYTLSIFKDLKVNIDQQWLDRYELEYYIHYWACKLRLRIVEVPVVIPYTHLAPTRKSKIVPLIGWWSMIRPFVYLFLGLKK